MTRSITVRQFILGGTFSSLAAILLVKTIGFAESIFVARIIGADGFGLLTLVLSLTNIMIAVATLGVPPAVTKFLAGEVATSSRASRTTLYMAVRLVALASAAVAVVVGLIGYVLIAPYYSSPALLNLLILAVIFVGLTAPLIPFANALQGLGKIARLNRVSVAGAAIGLGLAVVLAIAFAEKGALIAFLVGSAMPAFLAIRYVNEEIRRLPNRDPAIPVSAKTMLNYGLPNLLAGISVLAALYVMNSWLAVSSGFVDLGNFAVASSLAAVIGLIPSAMGIPLFPVLSSLNVSDPKRGRALVPRAMRITTFVSVPIVVISIIFAEEIIGVAYGPQFAAASPLLAILATSSLITSITGVVGSQMAGSGKMWLGLELNLLWAAVLVSAAAVLIPRFGALGASLATLTGYAVLGFIVIIVGKRKLSLSFDGVFVPLAWSLTFVGIALVLGLFGANTRIQAGVIVAVLSVVSIYLLLRRDERELVREALLLLRLQRRIS